MKHKKRLAGLLLLSACVCLTGCGEVKVVLTTELREDELFRIGETSCKLPEALVYLTNQKNRYEKIYGIEMWEHDFGEQTLEEYLKGQVVSQLAQIKSMALLAASQQVELAEDEKARASEAASEYDSTLSAEEKDLLGLDQEMLQSMYEEYCLAYKTYEQITGDVSVEISDDEARIIQLQQIFVPEEHLAENLKERLNGGEDFEALAANYSQASVTTVSVARGEKDGAYEEAAFNLDREGISEVVPADNGYYILKCLDTYLEQESEANKEKIEQQQKSERFREIYADLMEDTRSEFQDALWESVHIADYAEVETDSFFEIYQDYFEKE